MFDDLFDDLPTQGRMLIRRDLTRRVATVMDAERSSQLYLQFMRGELSATAFDEGLEGCILEHGMTRAEIEHCFPPRQLRGLPPSALSFNRKTLIATILWQEWQWVGRNRPPGNIRHFWYTHLMYTLMRIMSDTNIASIFSCYNDVLHELVRFERFRYAELNLQSTKSKLCEAIFTDSPYPNIILACEKESYHEYLKRLAHVLHITFISLGGQPSYGAFEDLVMDFLEAGIDIQQEFRLFTVSDFDPQGYDIQAAAKEHLECAGIRRVTIERVYLRPEHITPGIVERYAVPYEVHKSKAASTKAACTLYNKFGAMTGGIYKRGGAWQRFERNGHGYLVPQLTDNTQGYDLARVELDNFQDDVLLQLLIDALEGSIDGTQYYYAKARQIWRQTIKQRIGEAARAVIQRVVTVQLRPVRQRIRDLRERLDARWDELTTEESRLINAISEDRDFQQGELQARIDEIQEEIEALWDEQRDLERQQENLSYTADDMQAFLRAVKRAVVPTIPEAQEALEQADAPLDTHAEAQEQALTEPVSRRFQTDRVAIEDIVDFSDQAREVFRQARAGAQTFDAELSWEAQHSLTSAAHDDLDDQQEAMSVEVPALAEETMEVVEGHLQRAEDLLAKHNGLGNFRQHGKTCCVNSRNATPATLRDFA